MGEVNLQTQPEAMTDAQRLVLAQRAEYVMRLARGILTSAGKLAEEAAQLSAGLRKAV